MRVAGKIVWALWFATKSRSLPWVPFLGLPVNETLMKIDQRTQRLYLRLISIKVARLQSKENIPPPLSIVIPLS